MRKKITELYEKHGDILRYLIVGVMTTLIDIFFFFLLNNVLGVHYQVAKVVAWVLAIAFAFVGNKWLVFRTASKDRKTVWMEAFRFVAMRLLTLLVSIGFLYVAIDLGGWDENLSNILSNVLAIILNYILSKLVVFRAAK